MNNRIKDFFRKYLAFKLIAIITYVPIVGILYCFLTIEVSLLIAILISYSETHEDLCDLILKQKNTNVITVTEIENRIENLNNRIRNEELDYDSEVDIENDIYALNRMLLIVGRN